MKKIILLFVFIFFVRGVYSQKYQAFDSTTTWGTYYYYKVGTGCYVQQNLKYFTKGYQINNSNIWLKIYSSGSSSWAGSQFNCASLFPGYTGYSTGFKGFLFNDTINKKVYFTLSLPANYMPANDKLIYSFNKNVGDSMYVPQANVKFKITSIDSILFSGKYHKRFLTVATPSINTLNTNIAFTEGVGSSIDPFEPFKADGFESGSNLVCFSSMVDIIAVTNHSVFATTGSCSNLVLGISEQEKFDVTIYPNPASNKLSVLLGQSNYEQTNYKIFNVIGQEQLNGIFKESKNQINLEGIKNGIYFINFYKEERIIFSKKIIIDGN